MRRIWAVLGTIMLPLLVLAGALRLAPPGQALAVGSQIYVVGLADLPLALYDGGLPGLPATGPEYLGQRRLALEAPAAGAYKGFLAAQQDRFLADGAQLLGRALAPERQYQVVFNGLALALSAAEAELLATLPGVAQISPAIAYRPLSDAAPRFVGAPAIWDGSATGGAGNLGEGQLLAVVDTGIDYAHEAFADIGPVDGHDHDNPRGQLYGYCQTTNPALCNDKLIGLYDFSGDGITPTDFRMDHGSFVAHIAAGNFVTYSYPLLNATEVMTLSGVAPHANLISYDACAGEACWSHMIVAALEQAALDQVDVLNYSIGGTPIDPWRSPVTQAFLGVRAAGIFVAAAAGNRGPAAATIEAGADALWLLTVGLATHDRSYANYVTGMSGGDSTPPAAIRGEGISAGYGPAPIVHARDYDGIPPSSSSDGQCRDPFPAGTFSNINGSGIPAIVMCEDGGVAGGVKSDNILAGGAGGIVVSRPSLLMYGGLFDYSLPGMRIQSDEAAALRGWLASGSGHTATISGSSLAYHMENGDHLISFSSRGPNPTAPSVIRPDVIAPGWIAVSAEEGGSYALGSGTSFASPVAAGAAALIGAERPDWTVAEIQSAIVATAIYTHATKEDWTTPADPFDAGAGRVYVADAINAGLLFDESASNFALADPARNGQPAQLNLASLAQANCVTSCQWVRTVRNALPVTGSWTVAIQAPAGISLTVTPASFSLAPGAQQTFTVTATIAGAPEGVWGFGRLLWHEAGGGAPATGLPLAVRPAGDNLPQRIALDVRRDQGEASYSDLILGDNPTLTVELLGPALAEQQLLGLGVDPTPSDPYDNLNDGTTTFFTVTVPAGSSGLVAELLSSQSPDIDLYVGLDGGDGLPEAGELLCSSSLSSWVELCRLAEPGAGTYWVLLQNFGGSGNLTDTVTVATAVIPVTGNGELLVNGPAATVGGVPFALDLRWDLTATAGEVRYGRLQLSGDNADASIWLDLKRAADDVAETTVAAAELGDTVPFTLTIQPNLRWQDLHYVLSDTLPFGLQLISGTISGGGQPWGNGLTWTGDLAAGSESGAMISYQALVTWNVCLYHQDEVALATDLWHRVDDGAPPSRQGNASLLVVNLDEACSQVTFQFLPAVFR